MGLWFSCVSPLKCIQATCIPRSERGVRSRVKIVRNGSRYALFSETKLQACIILHIFTSIQLLPTACGLLSSPRRGTGQVVSHLRHEAADGGGLEGPSGPEEISQPCHLEELYLWEMSFDLRDNGYLKMDLKRIWTFDIWWICFDQLWPRHCCAFVHNYYAYFVMKEDLDVIICI